MAVKDKITVSLTDEALAAVRRISAANNISDSETVRRGIAILQFFDKVIEDGGTVLVRNSAGDLERVQFIYS